MIQSFGHDCNDYIGGVVCIDSDYHDEEDDNVGDVGDDEEDKALINIEKG